MSCSFSKGTAYGCDGLHPRHVALLSDAGIEALVRVFSGIELLWRLPRPFEFIVFVLLLKPGGGDRPIGLFTAAVRVWARLRRGVARQWEQACRRDFFYGSSGKSAIDCAWRQSLATEYARAVGWQASALLSDLTKAYESIDHTILWRDVCATGFHLGILHLLLWLYRCARLVSIDVVCSDCVNASCTVVAGCTFATTLMKVVLLRFGDQMVRRYEHIMLMIYVDDVQLLAAGHGSLRSRVWSAAAHLEAKNDLVIF